MATMEEAVQLLMNIRDKLDGIINNARLTPNQIAIQTINQLSPNLGLFQAGEFRTGNGVEPGSGFTGVRMGFPSFTYGGLEWHLVGIDNDVIQFGLNAADGTAWAGGGSVRMTASGLLVYKDSTNTGAIQSDGDVFFGSDIGAAATTSLCIFSNAQTYNSESVGAGDIMIGDNSTGKANLFWDASAEQLKFRIGTVTMNFLSTGSLMSIGARVRSSTDFTYTNNAITATQFDTEDYDDAGFVDLGSDNTKITIPTGLGGVYNIGFFIGIGYTGTPNGTFCSALLRVNGTSAIGSDTQNPPKGHYLSASGDIYLTAGDYLTLSFWNDSTSGTEYASAYGSHRPAMWARRIR